MEEDKENKEEECTRLPSENLDEYMDSNEGDNEVVLEDKEIEGRETAFDEEESSSKEQQRSKPKGPPVNCPERIVFFVDITTDWNNGEGAAIRGMPRNQALFQFLKKAIAIFLKTKSTINPKHLFALVLLQDSAVLWCQEFTNDVQLFLEMIADLELSQTEQNGDSEFPLDHLIQVLKQHCELPSSQDTVLPPEYVVRAILIYGRSKCRITYKGSDLEDLEAFQTSPFFFFDFIYVHEEPSSENKCEDIFAFLHGLNEDGSGFVLDACNDPMTLFEQMAKLLAHPLQRSTEPTTYALLKEDRTEELVPTEG